MYSLCDRLHNDQKLKHKLLLLMTSKCSYLVKLLMVHQFKREQDYKEIHRLSWLIIITIFYVGHYVIRCPRNSKD